MDPFRGKHLRLKIEPQAAEEVVDLIQLLQSITSDGRFSTEEIKELALWLRRNKENELPTISFLLHTVEGIISDGKITKDEQEALYKAVERVLPPEFSKWASEARSQIRDQNAEIVKAKKIEVRDQREVSRKQAMVDRVLNKKVAHYNFMVAGVHLEGRPSRIAKHAHEGDSIIVVREPFNLHSANACRLFLENGNIEIGFVPERNNWGEILAKDLAAQLDSGLPYTATIYKMLTSGRSPIPVVVIGVRSENATCPGLKRIQRKSLSRKKVIWILVLSAIFVLLILKRLL
jgi:hypothetical protein